MNVLITGAASGIGFNTGIKLAKKGYHVFLTTEDDKQLETLREKLVDIDNVGSFRLDITNEEDRHLLDNMDIDILISNAAIGQGGSILDVPMKDVRKCYDVNVFYNFEIIKLVCKKMLEKGSGKIIIMSSMLANISLPFFGIYASTKASISMLASSLRKEIKLINNSIKIAIIEPGIYKTGFNRFMIENGNITKYKLFNESIENLEKEILNFAGLDELDSISKKIICAIEDDNPKLIYRAPLLQNILIKLYIKFIKK